MATPPAILSGKGSVHARTVPHHNFKVDQNIESKAFFFDDNQPYEGRDEPEGLNDRIHDSPGFFDVDVFTA